MNTDEEKEILIFNSLSKERQSFVKYKKNGCSNYYAYTMAFGREGTVDERKRKGLNVAMEQQVKFLIKEKKSNPNEVVKESLIDEVTEELNDSVMSKYEMASLLTSIARANPGDLLELSPSGKALIDEETGARYEQTRWRLKNLDEVSDKNIFNAISEITTTNGDFKIKFHDKKIAMLQLSKILGYDKPKIVNINKNDKTISDFYKK